ncbi:MAG TPA: thioredoxin [Candidatus Choladousia intestinavium]|uniref:Thioredoxin n=1 Tax=Candidatus Choladousia intestinavium TaxID=2840727 RepID=A0A9D1A9V5_9FIRM|nr:thioredoxin [Candidatus Choladousia intestinavium]
MSVINITSENFQEEVLKSDKPVLLDFWASWCGPCRMVSPVIDEIAGERSDIKVGKVNVDEQQELAAQFQVMSIPTLLVLKDGQVVNKSVGAQPKAKILAML